MNFVIDACSAILLAKATLLETVFETYDIQITKQAYEEVAEGKKEMFADALLIERPLMRCAPHSGSISAQGTPQTFSV